MGRSEAPLNLRDWAMAVAHANKDDVRAERELEELLAVQDYYIGSTEAAELIREARRKLADLKKMEDASLPFVVRWRSALYSSGVDATGRWVLVALSLYARKDGTGANPSAGRIASDTGLSKRCVEGKLRDAEKKGWISRVKRAGDGSHWRPYATTLTIPVHMRNCVPHLKGEERAEPETPRAESDAQRVAQGSAKRLREGRRGQETPGEEDIEVKLEALAVRHAGPHVEEVL